MSRFGLRSKTDGLKISEEKSSSNDKKLIKSAKVELKRVYQKNKKLSLFTNADATNAQKLSSTSLLEKEDVTLGYNRTAASMICSLPLNRITGIIEKLKLTNSKPISKSISLNNEDDKNIREESLKRQERRLNDGEDDDENDDRGNEGEGEGEGGENQKQEQQQHNQIMKILCLYCEKQFTSLKIQLKHVEKFHIQHKDRRCSGRNSQTPPHELKKIKQQTSMQQNFPGCTFCKKTKASQLISAPAKELQGLFEHLTTCHADRYFGCKACSLRFQNVAKLAKHMHSVHNERLIRPTATKATAAVVSYVGEERSPTATKANDNSTDALPLSSTGVAATTTLTSNKRETKTRLQKSQKTQSGPSTSNTSSNTTSQQQNIATLLTTAATSSTIIGAEEPILSRLGLTQNRLPNNRARGVRLRRNGGSSGSGVEAILPEVLLKSDQTSTSVTAASGSASSLSVSPLKARSGKSVKSSAVTAFSGGDTEVVFRVPTRTEILSCVFDDDFYKEVVSNVHSNLHEHLDGKLLPTRGTHLTSTTSAAIVNRRRTSMQQPQKKIRKISQNGENCALHAATSLAATTAFPTLLTAQQYAGDVASGSSKIRRRPHTKHSWKWKWDSVKKFKLINEGGRIIKKMKQPLVGSGGLRDLSKLDMWTQLTMRHKHEQENHETMVSTSPSSFVSHWQQRSLITAASSTASATSNGGDAMREEKQRLNEQLNFILDMRLLPHIILEQNEQAIIKLENDYELGCGGSGAVSGGIGRDENEDDFIGGQSFTDAHFLSLLKLTPNNEDARSRLSRPKLVLSGEWARPRCYLCMCCGAKFDKLKSLEEHKMFRHSHILSTHYEVVGRELLAANLLRHFFIPKRALSRYGRDINMPVASATSICPSSVMRRFAWSKNSSSTINIAVSAEDESSDSLQSILHSCSTAAYNIKNSATSSNSGNISTTTTTDYCDDTTDTKNALIMLDMQTASPSHSMQSSSSSSRATATTTTAATAVKHGKQHKHQLSSAAAPSCTKCSRKCSGVLDLYRHMLDCSGDYIWSLAKKRKYRYYCGGSKKRRPCNKHHSYAAELRKQCKQKSPNTQHAASAATADTEESGSNCSKTKTPPRQRPSDAESIKKMLENLPAKRVCKKIFPTVTKAKKSKKSKLITKHKIYNTQVLRKTRARQISQAAKILSKTKAQFPNKTTTAQGLKALKRKNKNVSLLSKTQSLRDSTPETNIPIPASNNQDNSTIVVQMNNCQSPKEGELQINEIKYNDVVENVVGIVQKSPNIKSPITTQTTTTTTTTTSASNQQSGLEPKSELSSLIAPKVVLPNENVVAVIATRSVNDNLRSKKCEQASLVDVVSQNTTPTIPNLSLDCVTGPKTQISPQTEIFNCNNKKRSKKINDCIAMLTGKLEEKLKTEQKVVASSTKDICTETESKTCNSFSTSPDERKTPKRKTTSRRIIKPDTLNAKLPLNQAKKAILLTPTVQVVDSVTSATPTKENYSVPMVTQDAVPFPIPVFAAVPAPPVVPVPVTIELLPKLPVYPPIKKFKTTAPPPPPLSIPLPLPMQPMPSQVESIPANMSAPVTLLRPTLPPLSLPTAPQPPLLQQMHFNVEPLNLSNSNITQNNSSQNLTCSATQNRSNMPARRQTICGFEARNFIAFDEMEPLDLSKKSTNKDPPYPPALLLLLPPPPPPPARTVEISHNVPLELPSKNNSEPSVSQPLSLLPPTSLTFSLPPEILLNKQFYSNLDLLKIPQVRNPVYIPTEVANTSTKSVTITTSTITTAATSTIPTSAITTTKKRNNNISKNFNELASKPITINHISPGKTTPLTQKKENAAKTKITQKMDEVVNNHIDDAINSVINAVKASLTPDNAEETTNVLEVIKLNTLPKEQLVEVVPPQKFVPHPPLSTALVNVDAKIEVNAAAHMPPLKHLTQQKRCMRSKTLDCRPAALAQATANIVQQIICTQPPTLPAPSPIPVVIVENSVAKQCNAVENDVLILNANACDKSSDDVSTIPDKGVVEEDTHAIAQGNATTSSTTPIINTNDITNRGVELKNSEKSILHKDRSQAVEHGIKMSATIPVNCTEPEPESENSELVVIVVEAANTILPNANKFPTLPVSHETNVNSISEENISIINNTSSGFHSSGQSDNFADSKKKQRRRRKNELAAIVADQLLESFKIDKTRRDNLKKLENLAYEKSEDLLLTGMLLMSSTKRNASSTFPSSVVQTTTATTTTPVNEKGMDKNFESTKRQKADPIKNIKNKPTKSVEKVNHVKLDNSIVENTEKHVEDLVAISDQDKEKEVSDKSVVFENKEKDFDTKKSKRRQYRRRGAKTLENENISKLKSSLESFSIGIERQLSEIEAKNANIFNVTEPKTRNAVIAASAAAKTSSILRPSILSASLEQPSSNPNKVQSSSESSKTVVSSRDPRLNKNIHKADEKESTDDTIGVENAAIPTKSRLRSATAVVAAAAGVEKKLDEIGDFEEDNYLTEIAKNVNEKMTAENEEFVFANDGFEMANDLQDDSNSKYYRPSTSMSVRSAPNFNDDRSNFGSICDENTNTEVMDMDLDDDMSVYTSYSQDVGRGGRGRRRRRRRSILLKRRPKKRPSRDLSAEKFECVLCKKTFFTATSLIKHNMTLAHVSKVSELEYLQSKSMPAGDGFTDEQRMSPQLATISQHNLRRNVKELKEPATTVTWPLVNNVSGAPTKPVETVRAIWGEDGNRSNDCQAKQLTTETTTTEVSKTKNPGFNSTPRLTLNPDERLFFECCNILKGAETPRINNEDCNNGASSYTYAYQQLQDKTPVPCMTGTSLKPPSIVGVVDALSPKKHTVPERLSCKTIPAQTMQPSLFRDPQTIQSGFNKHAATINNTNEQNLLSANYSAISQFSAVTNTTSRFKTKAAMKGYENVNVNLSIQQELETKSRTVCKLTELAEIALGNEKPNSPEFSHHATDLRDESNLNPINTPEYNNLLLSAVDHQKDCVKNTETQSSSTSSKTIMHSSIIKAAVEEHSRVPSVSKIVIPDRPFKNIGLEEKETITFQKPKTVTVNLLTEDNSVSTASYSDRDDFDFGSMSCDEDASIKTSNEKNQIKNNSSDSSSSRATAKTFENKSLIMGRIFKNASTKPKSSTATAVKFKSVGVQKDQTPKADLNQLFDELRGGENLGKTKSSEATERKEINSAITEDVKDKHIPIITTVAATAAVRVDQPAAATRTKGKDTRTARKASAAVAGKGAGGASRKTQKNISKMQTELGMSQQEIEKLIDEGQRKSKRRCATNRPKKLVEIWSSDEYEEFLSTKDIIALIEEKEKEENRKKRKNSVNENKEKDSDVSHMTTTTTATTEKRKTLKYNSATAERKEKAVATATEEAVFEFKEYKCGEKSKTTVATEKRHKTSIPSVTVQTNKEKQQSSNSFSSRPDQKVSKFKSDPNKSNQNNGSSSRLRNKSIETPAAASKTKFKTPRSLQTAEDEVTPDISRRVTKLNPKQIIVGKAKESAAGRSEDDLSLSTLAKRNNRTSRNNKVRKDNSASREDVNYLKDFRKAATSEKQSKESAAAAVTTDVSKKRNSNKSYKCKRKTQANQSPPRRKRLAAEKLYYWSSSSDEDFGRINTSDAQEFESGEQYQKHGWIVGDSHKKLVTLLAIAKGNKKVENCGVKKNISKKKS